MAVDPDVAYGPTFPQMSKEQYAAAYPLLASQGLLAETFSRLEYLSTSAPGAAASGTLQTSAIYLPAGLTVTNFSIVIGVAPTTLTLGKVALYDSTGILLAATADQSAAWATTGLKTAAATAAYTITSSAVYRVGILQVATTPAGYLNGATGLGGTPLAGVGSGTSLVLVQTGLADIPSPATLVAPTNSGGSLGRFAWVGIS